MYCTHIPSSDRTIHLLISFVSFVLSVFLLYLSIYVYVTHVCKKKINENKKRRAGPYQFLHFLIISYDSLLNNFVDGIRSKKKTLKILDKNDVITE